jgi:hypothetical protein
MTQFTQLNLQGKSEAKPAVQTSQPRPQQNVAGKAGSSKSHGPRTLTIVGSAVALGLMGMALLETSGCSKAAKTNISAPAAQASYQPAVTPPAVAPSPESAAKKPVKKAVRRKIPTGTYTNADYGLSFRYPKYDTLKKGDDAKMEWTGLGPVAMNFSQPGGMTLSAVQMPSGLYPGTDFSSGFFNASVDPKLTAEQCEQFGSPADSASDSAVKPLSPSKVKIGKTEFSEIETLAGDGKQADAKYYHAFQNGNCYEFALGVQTTNDKSDDAVTPVSRKQVFRKLEWILSTVTIKSAVPEAVSATATAPASTTAVTSNTTTGSPETTAVKVIDDRR